MVLSRFLSLACFLGLMCSCLDQYNPRGFWQQLQQERAISSRVLPQLTAEGKLPANLEGGEGAGVEQAFSAATAFQTYCVACHNADGSGNPAMNSRNFTDPEWQALATDAEIAAVILHGALNAPQHQESLKARQKFKLQFATMVGWEAIFAKDPEKRQQELSEMVQYIRQFKK